MISGCVKVSMDLRFQHPFTAIVCGPSKAGKTPWTKRLVENALEMIVPAPLKIIWCYSEWQPAYENLSVDFMQGLPDVSELKTYKGPILLVLDDLMAEAKGSLSQIFTRGSHHWGISCVHIVQNLFFNGLRTSRINAQYLVLMKNPSDQLQVATLARQIFPGKTQYFLEAYKDACDKPYGYLLVDLNQNTPDMYRLRTNVFDTNVVLYTPKC